MKTTVLNVHPRFPELEMISAAVKILRQGGLVIFPTETVYGVGADSSNSQAIEKLKQAKRRSESKPFALLVGDKQSIAHDSAITTTTVYKLVDKYWPGPLTIVVPFKNGKSVGLRMPEHPVALRLVQDFGASIAAPSANLEGESAPVTCQQALIDLEGKVDVALDAGPTRLGIASTVVEVCEKKLKVLREGAIKEMDVNKTASRKTVLFVCTGNSCRSVMAEYLLKSMLKGRDDVEIMSAGTGVFIRSGASPDTLNILREHGIDASEHQARSVDPILLRKADLIFVMTRLHLTQVLNMVPEVNKRVYLLKEFIADSMGMIEQDVPDPIGQTYHEYKQCAELIKQALHKIVDLV